MSIPSVFDAIIVDADIQTRMLLKLAMTSASNFGKVNHANTLREGLGKIKESGRCDVIFISYEFPTEEVKQFVREAKSLAQGQDSAYVLVMKTKDKESSTVVENVLLGADGFLFQPYSVQYLQDIAALAMEVKKERQRAREEAAISFLVNDIINQIDLIAFLKAKGSPPGDSIKKLKSICALLPTLQESSLGIYYEVLGTMLEKVPAPKKIYQRKSYSGASSRLRRKFEQKMENAAAAGATDEPGSNGSGEQS